MQKLIKLSDEKILSDILSSFKCSIDKDIENFLVKKSVSFENRGKSRTFLFLDKENNFSVVAYFSIALHSFDLFNLSNTKIKKLDGFNHKNKNKKIKHLPSILIGQLGKNDNYKNFKGSIIMDKCLEYILIGQKYLSGRFIILECKNIKYLLDFYEKFGFFIIDKNYNKDELVQFFRVFKKEELIFK